MARPRSTSHVARMDMNHAHEACDASDDERWSAVMTRDARLDDAFVYAVRSTGVFCKPSCAAKRPRRDRVTFYSSPREAERAGFRACKRCFAEPTSAAIVERACARIREAIDADARPTMFDLARAAGVSVAWLHRVFVRAMGVTPKRFADAERARVLRDRLKRGASVTEATYAAGYGSSRALNEGAPKHLGMTPRAWKRGGAGETIAFAVRRLGDDALGVLLVARTERGVCAVRLGDSERAVERELKSELPAAELRRDDDRLATILDRVLAMIEGRAAPSLSFDLRATAFQLRVWAALQTIPRGETRTYTEVATEIGATSSVRAVARACASNPIAVVVPCHRVVRGDGDLAGYRWGLSRKKRLLERERR
jgi:AraC family transcriptional regulator of adaptative response/methylated-DNA-[protein]-cysteine methyltransferase